MADLPAMGNRILQLEYKLKAMAQRTRKEIIWRKQLEDWILKTFNYDLRLEVELKLLQSEGASDDFESLESGLNISQNSVFMGQTSITKTRKSAGVPTISPSALTNNRNFQPQISSPIRPPPKNISITTVPVSAPVMTQGWSQTSTMMGPSRPLVGYPNQGAAPMPPWPGQGFQRGRAPIQTQKRQRIANNVGNRPTRYVHQSPRYRHVSTPIIVSTSSMAPVKSPEVIVLDDDEDSNKCGTPTPNVVDTSSTVSAPHMFNLANTSTANTCSSGSNNSSITTSTNSATTNNFSVNNYGMHGVNNVNSSEINSLNSVGVSSLVSSSSGNSYVIDNSSVNINASSSGIFGNDRLGSSNTSVYSNNDFGPNLALHNIGEIADSENSNGDSTFQLINMIQMETHYAANNYISRNNGMLLFNVQKILLDYDSGLHNELLKADATRLPDLQLSYKKRINTNVCHFLMQVYGERVPRVAKEAMADSLFSEYPAVNKDEWFKKPSISNKNATGLIENKINNLRKNLRDHRKRIEQDPSLMLV